MRRAQRNRFLDKLAGSDTNIKDDLAASECQLCGNFTNIHLEKTLSTNPPVRKDFNTSRHCFLDFHVVHYFLGNHAPFCEQRMPLCCFKFYQTVRRSSRLLSSLLFRASLSAQQDMASCGCLQSENSPRGRFLSLSYCLTAHLVNILSLVFHLSFPNCNLLWLLSYHHITWYC